MPPPLPQTASRGWRFWAVFPPLCVATLLAAMEGTVTSTALPSIVGELHSGNNYVWILNGYLLTSTAFQPFYGQFAGVFGRRWPTMFAVAVFTLGSGISGGAKSTTMLIAGRVVQGIGGGGVSVMTQIIISDLVSVRERGKYMGIIFATFGIGTTIGPVLGGVIVQHDAWRWVFWLNLPIGGVTLLLQFFFLQVAYRKRFTLKEKLGQIDWVGNFILIGSVIAILIALSWADTRYPWSSPHVIAPLVIGFVGTVCFHVYEASKFCVQPTIPSRVFGNRTSATALVLTFGQSMLTFWRIYFLPVYFQAVRLVSPSRSGVLLLPTVTVGVPVAIVAGRLLTNYGRYKALHLGGFALMTLAAGLYIRFDASSSLAEVVVYQILAGLGTGCVLTTLLPAVQAGLSQADVAVATSTWGFIRSYGSIWGIAIPAAIFNNRFSHLLYRVENAQARAELGGGRGYSHIDGSYIRTLPAGDEQQVLDVYTASLKVVWEVALAFSIAFFLLVFLEKQIKLRTTINSDYGLKEKKKQQTDKEAGEKGLGKGKAGEDADLEAVKATKAHAAPPEQAVSGHGDS
ncbi:uncharacterized protein K452DRAFT_238184 [Aplosporella prunicola CBS 121167]|uniref:Major facilitator superfamily (MFS) profile domain-containing protein n=1 Tax=Aplosporella prunicola CBS 121167 TaxID=1176127 RepID=A0A6A6AYL8_9PEZI|nr:uncharacterized protein K452DRAFT_238184 [Aplosporella prunicola CBS 121167]KAF2136065.1 hypothetical protein K452DRAFT_238184 [Aplosporella prunicola CBS 121167]